MKASLGDEVHPDLNFWGGAPPMVRIRLHRIPLYEHAHFDR